ncbi:MAG: hypothetical protein C0506_06500 [Anaerolinea sp.]|nr:hypothetical protein [Anaerolinea sp.]
MTAGDGGRHAMADLWALLAELLSFPGPALEEEVPRGAVRSAVAHLAGHLDWDPAPLLTGLTATVPGSSLESEFIRLFDAPDGATTPLYTGVYSRRRRDAMEELLRFYRHFGLTVAGGAHDLPDYVPTVLEFLRFLTLRAATDGAGEPAEAAAADVIQRHLDPWAAQTARRLQGRAPHPFYAAAVGLVAAACALALEQRPQLTESPSR